MIHVTVTPATASGYKLNQYAQKTTAASSPEYERVVGEAVGSAIQIIRETGRDFRDYQYIVSFEDRK